MRPASASSLDLALWIQVSTPSPPPRHVHVGIQQALQIQQVSVELISYHWFTISGVPQVKSETGPHTWRARRNRGKRQPLQFGRQQV